MSGLSPFQYPRFARMYQRIGQKAERRGSAARAHTSWDAHAAHDQWALVGAARADSANTRVGTALVSLG